MKYFRLLASLLLLLTALPSFAGGDATTADPAIRDLKVLTWNIYMLPPIVPMKGRLERAQAIVDTLNTSQTDIIVFQEAFHAGALEVIRKGLNTQYPFMYGPFNPSHSPFRISSGVWVVSRIPLEVKDVIEFKIAKENDRVAKKGAALLEGIWGGRKFQILGTHLQAQEQQKIRNIQIRNMYDSLLAKYKVDGVPQIICGDMNTEKTISERYKGMLTLLDAEDGDMTGIQKSTYDGTNNELAESVWKKDKTSLDYILFRRNNAACHIIERHVGVFKRPWRKGHVDLSDHYAVGCDVKFGGEDASTAAPRQ